MTTHENELQASEVQLIYRSRIPAAKRIQIKTSQDAYNLFKEYWDSNTIEHVEEFKMLLMNNKNMVLGIASISRGGTSGTVTDPKIIFQFALKGHASAIIVGHNHPSNNPTPSENDVNITKRLIEAGNVLDIKVLDHIILCGDGTYYSLGDEGRLG
jgi:DNA repair protein RadC